MRQLRSPLTAILAGGGALSLAAGAAGDVAVIVAAIAGNAAVGAWQERQAGQAAHALERFAAPTARVLRSGREQTVSARDLVPGDVLILRSGDRVAADARLLESDALTVDEAALTGESMPVVKAATGGTEASRILLDGSDVTTGAAKAVVVAVGDGTRLGSIAAALREVGEDGTPLEQRLTRVLWRTLPFVALGGALVAGAGMLWGGTPAAQLALGATVALGAVPEGLPLLAGVAQAGVSRRLARRRALVTRLAAVEALGRVDVACADKTGTLTAGRLELAVVAGPDGSDPRGPSDAGALRDVLLSAAIACPHPEADEAGAHPTDLAVLEGARVAGIGDAVAVAREREAPFDPERPFHASVADGAVHVKGAPEEVVERCTGDRAALSEAAERLSARGLRVLLVARGPAEGASVEDPRGLTALGFVGIADPLRPGVADTVRRCAQAGVRVVMVTGDHPATAAAIAREAGLANGPESVVTAAEIASLDSAALGERLERASVIARSTPMDKVRIVEALRARGHVVAMTGDGVNDAPALRLADVGVAMGRHGTEVARQAADLILADDEFATLAEALVEGRSFWRNMRRALGLLLGGNAGEVGLMTAAALSGLRAPLNPRQVLTVNFVTDVLPALAVAVQDPEHRHLDRLRREGTEALDTRLRGDIIRRGVATALPSFAAYALAQRRPAGQSVAFASIVTTQVAQTLDLGRAEGRLTRPVLGAAAASLGVVWASLLLPPVRAFLGLAAPGPLTLVLPLAASAASVAISRVR
jgi:magnesium-transporting ATPase (P-type)